MHVIDCNLYLEHERKRKAQAEMLFRRSGEEIEEEKKLFGEYKRIEGFLKKQHQDQFRASSISDSITPDTEPKKKRKKRSVSDIDTDDHYVTNSPVGGRGGRRDRGSGAYVRSSRMQTPLSIGTNMMKKVDTALDEFKIPRRPIPTAFISKEYNELRQDIVSLLELQSLTKKKLFELEFYKKQLEIAKKSEEIKPTTEQPTVNDTTQTQTNDEIMPDVDSTTK